MSINSFDNYPMSWKPQRQFIKTPKYLSLAQMLENDIKNGILKPGTKLPPQRELADFLEINLSTVSRAFRLCEQKGLLSASVGNGTFVSSDATAGQVLLIDKDDMSMIEMGAIVPSLKSNFVVKQYMSELLKIPDAISLFSYGIPEGTKRHRQAGVLWLQKSGFYTDKEHIVLAAGGQNALIASLKTLFNQGDRVGTDPLTYTGMKAAAKFLGIHLIAIQTKNNEMTEEGILYAVQNENIKGLYVIPDFHNPTAHIMSLKTRKIIAKIAREKDLYVIEDGINNMFEDNPMPPIASFSPTHVFYLSSLSKTVSAGLRTAFIYVPDKYRQTLIDTLYSMNISISPLLATLSSGLIENGLADQILNERKEDIIKRNIIVNEILSNYVVDGELLSPLRYIHLPNRFIGNDFESYAKKEGVHVYSAEHFSVGNKPVEKGVRIAITTPVTLNELKDGLLRLKKVLDQYELS